MSDTSLILITGMSGSGKTTFTNFFTKIGYTSIAMGDVIRDLARIKGLDSTLENLGALAESIRLEDGDSAVADKCIEKLLKMGKKKVIIDGIRSLEEVDAFSKQFDVVLVAVHASPSTRFQRIKGRGRTDDPLGWSAFRNRDKRELGFNLGWAIALADYMVVNEGSLKDLMEAFYELTSQMIER